MTRTAMTTSVRISTDYSLKRRRSIGRCPCPPDTRLTVCLTPSFQHNCTDAGVMEQRPLPRCAQSQRSRSLRQSQQATTRIRLLIVGPSPKRTVGNPEEFRLPMGARKSGMTAAATAANGHRKHRPNVLTERVADQKSASLLSNMASRQTSYWTVGTSLHSSRYVPNRPLVEDSRSYLIAPWVQSIGSSWLH